MATLPRDLIPEILRSLGVKDLLRFRCVSKPWCSLIDSPDFIKLHLSHSIKTSTHLFIILQDSDLFSIEFDSLEVAKKINHPLYGEESCAEILGSCNGLLALTDGEEEIALWNPSTRKYQMLPVSEIESPRFPRFSAFVVYGLGHDPISGDYKLVRIVPFCGKDVNSFHTEVEVYSLRANSWRRIKDFPFYLPYKQGNGVFVDNALYWALAEKFEPDPKIIVVAFDLGTEEFRVVELPDCLDPRNPRTVKSMCGSLCLTVTHWETHVVDIWMMKESWTKLVSLELHLFNPPFEVPRPFAFSRNGDRVLLKIEDMEFVWYDLRSKIMKKVKIEGAPSSFEAAELLVQSLVPLNPNATGARISKKDHSKGKHIKKRYERDLQRNRVPPSIL